ncbi:MAG: hypothetical protein J5725_10360 [Bacteroidales bacterium]|nr:hypothetical protein [Bacteroidales bacterium]
MIEITNSEAASLKDLLDFYIFQAIRDDPDADNMVWLANLVHIWEKCGGEKEVKEEENRQ